jgi:septum formation protein
VSAPLVLASASPRRAELLAMLGIPFTIEPSRVDEEALTQAHRTDAPAALGVTLARAKALEVAARRPGARVLGADTLVVLDGTLLAKPANPAAAREMLARLSGRSHEVVTGVAVVEPDGSIAEGFAATVVTFARWPAAAVAAYVASGAPFDKAGGYGIQGLAGAYVERIDGCFFNVVGLPLSLTRRLLGAVPGEPANATPGSPSKKTT